MISPFIFSKYWSKTYQSKFADCNRLTWYHIRKVLGVFHDGDKRSVYWSYLVGYIGPPQPVHPSLPYTYMRKVRNIIFLSCLYRSHCGIWGCNSDSIFTRYQHILPHTSHHEQVSKDCKFKMHEVGFVQRWALHSINRNIYCVKQ